MLIQTYGVDDLRAGGKQLADVELADPPTKGLLCISLKKNP